MESGTERQAGQRRRWRDGRDERDGGLQVQFCVKLAFQYTLGRGTRVVRSFGEAKKKKKKGIEMDRMG